MTENADGGIEPAGRTKNRSIKKAWLRFIRNTILQPDFSLGVIVGIGIGFWAYYEHSVQLTESTVLTADIGAAVGLLAVTLAAMTLILSFLQGFYKVFIQRVSKTDDFFYAFQVIAVVSGVAAIAGIVSSLDADAHPFGLSSALFGVSNGFLTWAIIGAVQLVFSFVRHGKLWLEIDRGLSAPPPDIEIPDDLEGGPNAQGASNDSGTAGSGDK